VIDRLLDDVYDAFLEEHSGASDLAKGQLATLVAYEMVGVVQKINQFIRALDEAEKTLAVSDG
jgi:Flp pilus assembly pilin Flp